MKAPLCRAPDRPFGASVPPAPFNYGFLGPMNRWRPACTVLQRGAPPIPADTSWVCGSGSFISFTPHTHRCPPAYTP